MSKCSIGRMFFSLFLEVISFVSGFFIGGYFIDNSERPVMVIFGSQGLLFVATCFWVAVLVLTASLIYQSWGCVRVKDGILFPSNFNIDPIPAFTFIAINVTPVVLMAICGVKGMAINIGINADTLLGLYVLAFIGYAAYIQIRRNYVRDFLDEDVNESTFSMLLNEVGTRTAF